MELSFFDGVKQWGLESLPGKVMDALPHIIGFVLIIAVGFWISGLIGKLLLKIMEKRGVDYSIHRFLYRSVVILLRIIVSVIALEQIGVNVNSFVTAIGAAGITAGLGLQNSISQFASGIHILFNKPFKAGDFVEISGLQGTVKEIRFMFTTLVTLDNKEVVVPNQIITTNTLVNFTVHDMIRLNLKYTISYRDDIAKAKQVLAGVVAEVEDILDDPEPVIAVVEHAGSGVVLTVLAYTHSGNYWKAFYAMQEKVKLAFDENGITIPYNRTDVHIVGNDEE